MTDQRDRLINARQPFNGPECVHRDPGYKRLVPRVNDEFAFYRGLAVAFAFSALLLAAVAWVMGWI